VIMPVTRNIRKILGKKGKIKWPLDPLHGVQMQSQLIEAGHTLKLESY
jgi:hypothetical protein